MEIAQDRLHDGDSLPSVRSLAKDLGVNMHTVNKAYAILREEGYLKLDRRKGAIVSVERNRKEAELEKINSYMQMISRPGHMQGDYQRRNEADCGRNV